MKQPARTGARLAVAGIAGSAFLAAVNIAVGWRGGSTAVVAAGVEFAGDVLASFIVLLGFLAGSRPADDNHPYGHGRLESLAGFVVGLILVAGGCGICYSSLSNVAVASAPPQPFTLWALALSIVVKSVLSALKFHYGRLIRSTSLVADAWNDGIDLLSAVAAMGAVLLTLSDPIRFHAADHYGGFAVGVVVIYTALRVVRDASLELMDTMPNEGLIAKLRMKAAEVHGVKGVEKCFARKTGLQYHVDLHLEVDPEMTVRESHEVAAAVRSHIRETMPEIADVLVHVEPHLVPRGPGSGV